MVNHTTQCGCTPLPHETLVTSVSGRSKLAREITEAFWIHKEQENAVSEPSIKLTQPEIQMLEKSGIFKGLINKSKISR